MSEQKDLYCEVCETWHPKEKVCTTTLAHLAELGLLSGASQKGDRE